ncbi:MAG TPA: NADH-ubiquinone oxidoreductase-F iron-sulfur binding region domain-containing protein [Acidimicrobiales bacterium]|nr:NADH-ubiquinone oxidoreductase-F iron-sulfur binding region domain-containing protein [Acidimicrobiales bacterium]
MRAPTEAPPATALPRLLALSPAAAPGLAAHLERWGPPPPGGPGLIGEVERAGLRGRGGAAFPTALKMRAVAARGAGRAVVVGNGVEREPVSFKDKALLASAPHLVLDGLVLAAEAVGASEAVLCIDRGAPDALRGVATALTERSRHMPDPVPVRVAPAPGAYVAGEESALVHWLNGGPAKPTYVPPRPFERGVGRRPTLVDNVETLAHVALIARFGAEWFRALGTPADPGSCLLSIGGDVTRPGVYEAPYGAGLADLIGMAGPSQAPQAVLVGGYSGAWVPVGAVSSLRFDSESLAGVEAGVGCAAISVLGAGRCGLMETARAVRWMAGQSAGQCGPCANGLPALAEAFDQLVRGGHGSRAERRVAELAQVVAGRGACHHPDGVIRMATSAIRVFAAEVAHHRELGPCGGHPGALTVPAGRPVWR